MIDIRSYRETDALAVGRLIAATYSEYNLSFLPLAERGPFLGPFCHAESSDPEHQRAIRAILRSPMLYVAEDDGQIVGVLRGRPGRLASLFVRGDRHRQGIGRQLVERFERDSRGQGVTVLHVAATLYGVPFYRAMGYKRSTGIRVGHSFHGHGLPIQPMRKALRQG